MTTPQPPQGGNPYAQNPQGGNPYGQPPQSGNPYGQPPQGGNPYAQNPQPGGVPGQTPPPPPQPGGVPGQIPPPSPYMGPAGGFQQPQPPKRSKVKLIAGLIVAAVVIGGGIYGFVASQDDAKHAEVGDCLHQTGGSASSPELSIVDCSDSKAEYTVVKKIKDGLASDCDNVSEAQYGYEEKQGSDSFALCLKDV